MWWGRGGSRKPRLRRSVTASPSWTRSGGQFYQQHWAKFGNTDKGRFLHVDLLHVGHVSCHTCTPLEPVFPSNWVPDFSLKLWDQSLTRPERLDCLCTSRCWPEPGWSQPVRQLSCCLFLSGCSTWPVWPTVLHLCNITTRGRHCEAAHAEEFVIFSLNSRIGGFYMFLLPLQHQNVRENKLLFCHRPYRQSATKKSQFSAK